jgi:hypothetical protein
MVIALWPLPAQYMSKFFSSTIAAKKCNIKMTFISFSRHVWCKIRHIDGPMQRQLVTLCGSMAQSGITIRMSLLRVNDQLSRNVLFAVASNELSVVPTRCLSPAPAGAALEPERVREAVGSRSPGIHSPSMCRDR